LARGKGQVADSTTGRYLTFSKATAAHKSTGAVATGRNVIHSFTLLPAENGTIRVAKQRQIVLFCSVPTAPNHPTHQPSNHHCHPYHPEPPTHLCHRLAQPLKVKSAGRVVRLCVGSDFGMQKEQSLRALKYFVADESDHAMRAIQIISMRPRSRTSS